MMSSLTKLSMVALIFLVLHTDHALSSRYKVSIDLPSGVKSGTPIRPETSVRNPSKTSSPDGAGRPHGIGPNLPGKSASGAGGGASGAFRPGHGTVAKLEAALQSQPAAGRTRTRPTTGNVRCRRGIWNVGTRKKPNRVAEYEFFKEGIQIMGNKYRLDHFETAADQATNRKVRPGAEYKRGEIPEYMWRQIGFRGDYWHAVGELMENLRTKAAEAVASGDTELKRRIDTLMQVKGQAVLDHRKKDIERADKNPKNNGQADEGHWDVEKKWIEEVDRYKEHNLQLDAASKVGGVEVKAAAGGDDVKVEEVKAGGQVEAKAGAAEDVRAGIDPAGNGAKTSAAAGTSDGGGAKRSRPWRGSSVDGAASSGSSSSGYSSGADSDSDGGARKQAKPSNGGSPVVDSVVKSPGSGSSTPDFGDWRTKGCW